MYRKECIDKYVRASIYRLVYLQKRIDMKVQTNRYWQLYRQVLLGKHIQESMYSKYIYICMHVQTSIGTDKKIKTSIEWANIGYVSTSVDKSRDKSEDLIVDKSMKKYLYKYFS